MFLTYLTYWLSLGIWCSFKNEILFQQTKHIEFVSNLIMPCSFHTEIFLALSQNLNNILHAFVFCQEFVWILLHNAAYVFIFVLKDSKEERKLINVTLKWLHSFPQAFHSVHNLQSDVYLLTSHLYHQELGKHLTDKCRRCSRAR